MKKFFAIAVMAVAVLSANAQTWVGGQIGFNSTKENKDADAVNTFTLNPEVGYNLDDKWAIGAELLYQTVSDTYDAYGVGIFARYNAVKSNNFTLFIEPSVAYSGVKQNGADETGNTFQIGVRPGIKYALNNNFELVAKTGVLGYSKNSDNIGGGSSFDFGVNNTTISFGLEYKF